jgi:predicted permease
LKEKGFAAAALLTLALCIGANAAVFSMVYALILRPPPFPAPARIVEIYNAFPKVGFPKFPCNFVQYVDVKKHTDAFDAVGLYRSDSQSLGEPGSADRVVGAACTADMFDVLGIKPLIGHFFTLENCRYGNDKVLVITESFWKSHFSEDPAVLGRKIHLGGDMVTIVGVAPDSFGAFDEQARYIKPAAWGPHEEDPGQRYSCFIWLYARMKPGVPQSRALGEVQALEQKVYDTSPPGQRQFLERSGHRIQMGGLQAERVAPIRASFTLIQGGAIFVLLIGCVNIANLLLARANSRQGELAVRAALGAGRWHIARQLLVESLVLTLIGAALGVGLGYGSVHVINHYTARLLPNMLPVVLDRTVLGATLAGAVVVGLLMGLFPVVHVLRSNLSNVLRRSSRSASDSRGIRALSGLLVAGQVAVALMLLCGAGLLIRSFVNAISVRPGFDPDHLVVATLAVPAAQRDKAHAAAFQKGVESALREIAGVEDTALSTGVPFKGDLPIDAFQLKDSALPADTPQPGAYIISSSSSYFHTLRIPLLEGRLFDDSDAKDGRGSVIVDRTFARKFFPGRTAVGGHFSFGQPKTDADWLVIVGVVGDVPHNGVEDKTGNPFIYQPLERSQPWEFNLFVRSSRPAGDILQAIRDKAHVVAPTLVLFDAGTEKAVIDASFDNRRAVTLLLACFAFLALFLSAVGIYGVLAYDISQRTREIGIRGAIGASREQIIGMIVRQGAVKTAVGLVAGLVGAVFLSRYMASLLFDLSPWDPWSFAAVVVVLAAVAMAASYLPARRAARVDPIEALRSE